MGKHTGETGVCFWDHGKPNHAHFYDPVWRDDVDESETEWVIRHQHGHKYRVDKIKGREVRFYTFNDNDERVYDDGSIEE